MLVRARESSASPLILPLALAFSTVPLTVDRAGIAAIPPTLTGCANVARKVWPVWLALEPNACPTLTVRVVPAGTTMGWGGGGGGGAGCAGCVDSGWTAV